MANRIGIWFDKRIAKIVSIDQNGEQMISVESNLEEFRPKGGSGHKMKGGPQDVVQDSRYLEREKHQLKAYFKEVASHLSKADSVVVFGPADTGRKFVDEIAGSYRKLHQKITAVEKADSMTDNQVRAWVREYYNQ